ncbi:lasso peptide biosynthesis B2 protein [Glaciecola siphonariae]|uniref:Lasso peptide biosynthesis B2 protein n=1 Tax=Glaciecola siphonariae TaxID=521012 RepID=A0ABV9LYE2_9ALTE
MLTLKYNYLILLESLWYLRKWDRIIGGKAFEQWQEYLDASSKNAYATNLSSAQMQKLRKHIDAIVRKYPKELNCMRRCLALKSMIERRGGHCTLHIGVKFTGTEAKASKTLAAHAWLSAQGTLINDTPSQISQYQEITHNNALFGKNVSKSNT